MLFWNALCCLIYLPIMKKFCSRQNVKYITIDSKQQNGDDSLLKICKQQSPQSQQKRIHLKNPYVTWLGISYLKNVYWSRLIVLSICNNRIGNLGCKYLTRIKLPAIRQVSLLNNSVDCGGIQHLVKAQWRTLRQFQLQKNILRLNAVRYLTKSNWKQIQQISLYDNLLSKEEVTYIVFLQAESFTLFNASIYYLIYEII